MIFCSHIEMEFAREAARLYAADLFNWFQAQRDYPYAQHREPDPPRWLGDISRIETRQRVEREWRRSNA